MMRMLPLAACAALVACQSAPLVSSAPQPAAPAPSAPGLSAAVLQLAIDQLWPMAQAELNAYAAAHPGTLAAEAIVKGLPAVTAEYAKLHDLTAPHTPAQFLAAAEQLVQSLPPGTIGTADLAHVQTILGFAQAAVQVGLVSAASLPLVHGA